MSKVKELLRQGRDEELWRMCCGFLELNVGSFMNIQNELLLEQLDLLGGCRMGRKLMRGAMPHTIADFRERVPLTTYKDYCPELLEKQESGLPVKPAHSIQTSGRSGEYPCKWVPVSEKFWDEAGLNFCAIAIMAACRGKGDIAFKNGFKLLHAAALKPCLTGHVAEKLRADTDFNFVPSLVDIEEMSFDERVQNGFNSVLNGGMDGFFGLGGVLVGIGEKFKYGSGSLKIKQLLKQPRAAARLARGIITSKAAGRHMIPSDLWKLKVIVSMGTDSMVYQNRIRNLWGRTPLNVYGNSESTVIATQTWDYRDMVFFPNLNFLEFVPEEEYMKWQINHYYRPKTVLLDEVKEGGVYELVISNFHGGIMVRYRMGELIRITALRNQSLGIELPQIAFDRRGDDLIDLGFMRLTEKVIGQALENTGIPYKGWTARKETFDGPRLRLYIELQSGISIIPNS